MNCREVMSENPACCLPTDTVSMAARVMRREDIGPVPVISDEQSKQLIGIVTDRDLSTAIKAMEAHQIRRIPVVDEDGRIAGIISQGDVAIRIHQPERTGEIVEEISQAA